MGAVRATVDTGVEGGTGKEARGRAITHLVLKPMNKTVYFNLKAVTSRSPMIVESI